MKRKKKGHRRQKGSEKMSIINKRSCRDTMVNEEMNQRIKRKQR